MTLFDSPEWQKISEEFTQALDGYQKESIELWNSLPYDDRLKLFCAITSLIYKGEIKEKGTYRYVLYNVFGFDLDSYVPAQHSGYMAIHNAIYDGERLRDMIKDFVSNHMDITKDNLDEQLDKFVKKSNY
jgi:hypothetical protein